VRRAINQPSAVPSVLAFWWWLVLFPWCVGVGGAMCCDVVCDVMWLAALRHHQMLHPSPNAARATKSDIPTKSGVSEGSEK